MERGCPWRRWSRHPCLQNTGYGTQSVFGHRMDSGIWEVFPSTADPVTPRRDSGAPGAALTHNMDPPLPFCGRCSPRAPDTGGRPRPSPDVTQGACAERRREGAPQSEAAGRISRKAPSPAQEVAPARTPRPAVPGCGRPRGPL